MIGLLRRLQPPATPNEPAATALLEQLGAQRLEPSRELRGHDFFPPRRELQQVPRTVTAYRRRPAVRVLHLHYLSSYSDCYVAGFDPRTGWAVGYTNEPRLGLHDWGWFDLNVMCTVRYAGVPIFRRDLAWRPQPARTVIAPDRLAG